MQLMLVLTHRYLRKYKNITFVNIFLIYSHYEPGNPFVMGGYFFLATPCTPTQIVVFVTRTQIKLKLRLENSNQNRF